MAQKLTRIGTVLMSGGAPTSPLMAGFLHALLENGRTFDEFHTSGAGALMALLSISPKDRTPMEALRDWVENGVADEVYGRFPVNFKLFRKPGPFAPLFKKLAERFKVPVEDPASIGQRTDVDKLLASAGSPNPTTELLADWLATARENRSGPKSDRDEIDRLEDRLLTAWSKDRDDALYKKLLSRKDPIKRIRDNWLLTWLETDEQRRTYNDLIDLWFSALTPTTLNYRSKGLAAPLPFLDDIVDFKALVTNLNGRRLAVNAYNTTKDAERDHKFPRPRPSGNQCHQPIDKDDPMEIFENGAITARHIRAAFSMPFIYPPTEIDGQFYSEGADQEPINFRLLRDSPGKYKGQTVVLLDALGALEDLLVRTPRDLWDAYVISIVTPIVGLANMSYKDFKGDCGKEIFVRRIRWRIPPEAQPHVMDWSYSNLSTLFRIGRARGEDFVKHGIDYKYPDGEPLADPAD